LKENPAGQRPRTVAIIPSAGLGRRMNSPGTRKTYMPLAGRPVLAHTLAAFEACPAVDSVIVVVNGDDIDYCAEEVVERYGFAKVAAVVAGGAERQDSVARGMEAAGPGWDIIAVHDGARPLVTPGIIEDTVRAAAETGAAVSAVPVKDTIKAAKPAAGRGRAVVARTIPRDELWAVHTPQAFRASLLAEAHERARRRGVVATDESSLVEDAGKEVTLVPGSYENIKITTAEDIHAAEAILGARGR